MFSATSDVWFVMTLVDQDGAPVLQVVLIWGIRTKGHEDHRMITAQAEVHSALEAGTLALAHLEV